MSKHWAWFLPEVHTNTGRLCSAGSKCHLVPRRFCSYAALRLPIFISHGSGSFCPWPISMPALVLLRLSRFKLAGPSTPRDTEASNAYAILHDSLGPVCICSLIGINSIQVCLRAQGSQGARANQRQVGILGLPI